MTPKRARESFMPTISLRVLLLLVASCDGAFSATSPVMARDNPASAAARPAFGVSMRATSSSGASTLTTKKTVADILDDMPLGRFHAFHLLRATYIWCTLGACAELAAYIFDGVALELGATTVQSGILASAFPAGCMIGALLSAAIGDKFGRRTLLLSSSSSACLLSIGMSLSPTFGALVVLRVLSSVAWAVAFTITLVWYTEFLPTKGRGALANAFGVGWPVGRGLVIATLGAVGPSGWRRVLMLSAALFGGMAALLSTTAQESPRRLMITGDPLGARRVLEAIGRLNNSPLAEGVELVPMTVPPGAEEVDVTPAEEEVRELLDHDAKRSAEGLPQASTGEGRLQSEASSPLLSEAERKAAALEGGKPWLAAVPSAADSTSVAASGVGATAGQSGLPGLLKQTRQALDMATNRLMPPNSAVRQLVGPLSHLFTFAVGLMCALSVTTVLLDTWGPRTFARLFGSSSLPLSTLLLFNLGDLGGIVASIFLVDRIGRRGCFKIGFLVQASLLSAMVAVPSKLGRTAFGILAASTRCFGWEAAHLWIIEAFPTTVRATALAASIAIMRLSSVAVLALSGYVIDSLTAKAVLLIIAGLQLIAGITAVKALPCETSGAPMKDR